MDDEDVEALEVTAQRVPLPLDDGAAAEESGVESTESIARHAGDARELIVRARDVLRSGHVPPDVTVIISEDPPTVAPIWDSAREPFLRYDGWTCRSPDPLNADQLVLPSRADTMIGSRAPVLEGGETEHFLFTDEDLARCIGDGSLTTALTELLVGHGLGWPPVDARPESHRERIREWWRRLNRA